MNYSRTDITSRSRYSIKDSESIHCFGRCHGLCPRSPPGPAVPDIWSRRPNRATSIKWFSFGLSIWSRWPHGAASIKYIFFLSAADDHNLMRAPNDRRIMTCKLTLDGGPLTITTRPPIIKRTRVRIVSKRLKAFWTPFGPNRFQIVFESFCTVFGAFRIVSAGWTWRDWPIFFSKCWIFWKFWKC